MTDEEKFRIKVAIAKVNSARISCENAGDTVKAGFLSRMADALEWAAGNPHTAFADQLRMWDEVDRGNILKARDLYRRKS